MENGANGAVWGTEMDRRALRLLRISGDSPGRSPNTIGCAFSLIPFRAGACRYASPGSRPLHPIGPTPLSSAPKGDKKYVYHYGDRPEEFYDFSEDPSENNNLADERSPGELRKRRLELLEWRARVEAMYSPPPDRGR
jgi:hypothetical protein